MQNKKSLVKFNVKNIKYALPNGEGGFLPPVAYGSATKISLEADTSSKKIYGDGKVIINLINDKGKTGSFTTNAISEDYEIAMGRKLKTATGVADIKQYKIIEHCIYFETSGATEDGAMPVAKTWLYGVTSSRPSEEYNQNTDDINESSFSTPLEIKGTAIITQDKKEYLDEQGNVAYAWQMTVLPGDPNYETFGDAVVLPTISIGE